MGLKIHVMLPDFIRWLRRRGDFVVTFLFNGRGLSWRYGSFVGPCRQSPFRRKSPEADVRSLNLNNDTETFRTLEHGDGFLQTRYPATPASGPLPDCPVLAKILKSCLSANYNFSDIGQIFNVGALCLYERLGFKSAGLLIGRVKLPDGSVEDDIPMSRNLALSTSEQT